MKILRSWLQASLTSVIFALHACACCHVVTCCGLGVGVWMGVLLPCSPDSGALSVLVWWLYELLNGCVFVSGACWGYGNALTWPLHHILLPGCCVVVCCEHTYAAHLDDMQQYLLTVLVQSCRQMVMWASAAHRHTTVNITECGAEEHRKQKHSVGMRCCLFGAGRHTVWCLWRAAQSCLCCRTKRAQHAGLGQGHIQWWAGWWLVTAC